MGKTAGQRERFTGGPGSRSRRLGIHNPYLAGQRGHNRAGLGDPTFEVKQAGQALAEVLGNGICRFTLGKPSRDLEDIADPPTANGQ